MPTANQDVEISAGQAIQLRFEVVDEESGAPLPLTGAALRWSLWRTDGTVLIAKTSAGGAITLEAGQQADTTVVVQVDAADTAALRGHYQHDLAVLGDGPAPLARGAARVRYSGALEA